jgi:flagellar hook-associated protein 1 FlgK
MSFAGIHLATRALLAHQRALEVTGQNITNVDTPGYSRQVALLQSVSGPGAQALDRSGNPIAPGGGVDVAQVLRTHAAWLDQGAARLATQLGQLTIGARTSRQVEDLLAEPTDGGIQATVDRFLAAFGNLANHADDLTARDGVIRAGKEVATRFQQFTEGLDGLRGELFAAARDNVAAINSLARQVADLGRVIGQAQAAGAAPNELLDQRDQLLQELTRRAGATYSGQETGQVVVSVGGVTLVQGEHVQPLELAPGGTLAVVVQGSGQAVTVPGGELRAQQDWTNNLLPGYQSRMNTVRDSIAAAVNSLHQSGKDATGAPGLPFFVADSGGNLRVNDVLLADAHRVVAGDGTAGSGSVALQIANLGSAGATLLMPYRTLVADIGTETEGTRRLRDQTDASLQQIQALQGSESGVNLDEELANMTELQHAYAASARLLSAYDQMLTTLIERTGA